MSLATTSQISSTVEVVEFCLIKTVRQWPYKKVPKVHQAILKRFFDKDQFFGRHWDVYLLESYNDKKDFLIPHLQVEDFFKLVQTETGVNISMNDKTLRYRSKQPDQETITHIGSTNTVDEYDQIYNQYYSTSITTMDENNNGPNKKQQSKDIKKAKAEQKRLLQAESWKNSLKSAVDLVNTGEKYAFVAVDVESWERNHDIITEIGFTSYTPGAGGLIGNETQVQTDHILVKENRSYKNGTYVSDSSDKFQFGQSRLIPQNDLKNEIDKLFNGCIGGINERQLIFIGHDVDTDIEYLKRMGIDLDDYKYVMKFDTVSMWKGLKGTANGISLSNLCNELDIDAWFLHNAGNDAHYTMLSFLGMVKKFQIN